MLFFSSQFKFQFCFLHLIFAPSTTSSAAQTKYSTRVSRMVKWAKPTPPPYMYTNQTGTLLAQPRNTHHTWEHHTRCHHTQNNTTNQLKGLDHRFAAHSLILTRQWTCALFFHHSPTIWSATSFDLKPSPFHTRRCYIQRSQFC